MYTLRRGGVIRDLPDGGTMAIPENIENVDWRSYLDWVAQGNIPAPEQAHMLQTLPSISDRQFYHMLARLGVITPEEAIAAVGPGTLPQAVASVIDTLPDDQKFGARMLLIGATMFERDHPMVSVFMGALGWSSDQVDEFWRGASRL